MKSNNQPVHTPTWKVGTSSALFLGLVEQDIEAVAKAGLDCIEVNLMGQWFHIEKNEMADYCSRLATRGEALGIDFWSIHLPFGIPWDICCLDEEKRSKMLEKYSELLEFSTVFKPKKAVIHPSWEPVDPQLRGKHTTACRKSLSVLSQKANQLGIQLAVECLPRTCLGNSTEDMIRLTDGIEHLGICCDTNHLLSDRTEDFIRYFGSKVVTLHVSDYDRINERHWLPGLGVNDWNAVIDVLQNVGYNGPIMFEVSQANPEKPITPADLKACWGNLLQNYYRR